MISSSGVAAGQTYRPAVGFAGRLPEIGQPAGSGVPGPGRGL